MKDPEIKILAVLMIMLTLWLFALMVQAKNHVRPLSFIGGIERRI